MEAEELDNEVDVEDEVNKEPEESEGEGEEPLYTQAQVNQIVEARLARERKKATDGNRIKTLRTERDTARKSLEAKEAELEGLRHERFLISLGVNPEDAEYYAFHIGKEVDEDHTFEDIAKERAKNGKFSVRVETGASVSGNGGRKEKTTNDEMNALIRGARK